MTKKTFMARLRKRTRWGNIFIDLEFSAWLLFHFFASGADSSSECQTMLENFSLLNAVS